METKRVLNWRPSLPDHRDFCYSSHFRLTESPLPSSVCLEPLCPPIVDQLDQGSCTANAGGSGAADFLQLKGLREKTPLSQDPEIYVAGKFMPCSRDFIYYCERAIDGTVNQDAGASMRDVAKVLCSVGAPAEATWPYNKENLYKQPSHAAYTEAAKHKMPKFFAIYSLDDMRHCLTSGFPFIGGLTLYSSFMSDYVASTGIVPIPGVFESVAGGHALCFVGYNDETKMVRGRNSWGASWGQAGYFDLPYDYITNSRLASDFFTFRDI